MHLKLSFRDQIKLVTGYNTFMSPICQLSVNGSKFQLELYILCGVVNNVSVMAGAINRIRDL